MGVPMMCHVGICEGIAMSQHANQLMLVTSSRGSKLATLFDDITSLQQ